MSKTLGALVLDDLLGSRTRARLVAALLVAPDGRLHLRALVRACGGSIAAVQRELQRLEAMGLVESTEDERGRRQVSLVADHPFAGPIAGLVAADPRSQYECRVASVENMDREAADEIGGFVDAIVAGFDPIRIILFGSRARGTAHPDSDVDLLVVMPKLERDRDVSVALSGALPRRRMSVDVIATDPDRIDRSMGLFASVVRDAVEEGVVLYERIA